MHQLQHARTGSGLAQLLDHAKTHAAAAVHRHAGRFVYGHHLLVFHQNREFTPGRDRRIDIHSGDPHRRQADHIAGLHPGVGIDPALVDAHFAGADDAVDMGFGYAFEMAQ